MEPDILAALRDECGYDEDAMDGSVDDLIEYKNALEGRLWRATERIQHDIAFHQEKAETAQDPDVHDPEGEVAESYHTGRVEAMTDAFSMLDGTERKMYSETVVFDA